MFPDYYKAREKAYVIAGAVVGTATPIVLGRYALFNVVGDQNELAAWGLSVLLNCIPTKVHPYRPLPLYTGVIGAVAGALASERSVDIKERRERQIRERHL